VSTEEAALVRRCLKGDGQAVESLVAQFHGPVYSLCVRILSHRHDAEDVTQEVFLRVFRSLRRCGKKRASTVGDLAVMAEFVPGVKQTRRRVWLRCIADGCLVAVLLAL